MISSHFSKSENTLDKIHEALKDYNVSSGRGLIAHLQRERERFTSLLFGPETIASYFDHYRCGRLQLRDQVSGGCVRYPFDLRHYRLDEASEVLRHSFHDGFGVRYITIEDPLQRMFGQFCVKDDEACELEAVAKIKATLSFSSWLRRFDNTFEKIVAGCEISKQSKSKPSDIERVLELSAIGAVHLHLSQMRRNYVEKAEEEAEPVAKFLMSLKAHAATKLEEMKKAKEAKVE